MWIKSTLVLLVFLFSGCTSSITNIQIKKDTIYANNCKATLSLTKIKKSFHAGNIDLVRTFYKTETNDILIHEHGILDENLEFIVSSTSLMYAGFEFKRYKVIPAGKWHDVIYGIDKNGNPIYLLYSAINSFNEFEVIYTRNKSLIEQLIPCLIAKDTQHISIVAENSNIQTKDLVASDWGNLIFLKHEIANSKYFVNF